MKIKCRDPESMLEMEIIINDKRYHKLMEGADLD